MDLTSTCKKTHFSPGVSPIITNRLETTQNLNQLLSPDKTETKFNTLRSSPQNTTNPHQQVNISQQIGQHMLNAHSLRGSQQFQLGASLISRQNTLGQSIDLPFNFEMILKDRLDQSQQIMMNAFANSEAETLRLQLEKSRKEYKRLLGQLDEDQDELIQLRQKNRKVQSENGLLQQKFIDQQIQFNEEIKKVKQSDKPCQCSAKITHLNDQIESKNRDLYSLTKQLGCIQTENSEYKREI